MRKMPREKIETRSFSSEGCWESQSMKLLELPIERLKSFLKKLLEKNSCLNLMNQRLPDQL